MSKIDKIISNKLKALREKSGYSQQDIADFLDITLVRIKLMESGIDTIPATLIYYLCFILDCSPNELFPPLKKPEGRKQEMRLAVKDLIKKLCV
jgi:transcriptional regulator with XRE-family HTH domain